MRYLNSLSLPVFLITAFMSLLGITPSYAQDVQLSASAEAAAIADLESGDVNRITRVINILPIPYDNPSYENQISYSMALALIEASERATDEYFDFSNRNDEEEGEHEFAAEFSDFIVPLRIPEAIPALLKASQFGNSAAYAIADFGPDIVYTIIEYIDDPQRTLREIRGAFLALQRTIETHSPLSPSIRSAAKEITVRYLERAEEFYSGPDGSIIGVITAISVARVLGDPDLKQMVIDIIPFEKEQNLRFNGMGSTWAQETLDNWDVVQEDQIYQND